MILNWLAAADVPRVVGIVREAAAPGRARPGRGRDHRAAARQRRSARAARPTSACGATSPPTSTCRCTAPTRSGWGAAPRWRPCGRRGSAAIARRRWRRCPPSVMDDLILRGSMAEIRAHVQRYLDAGIDTAFLQVSTLEQDPDHRRQFLLDALRALARRRAEPRGHASAVSRALSTLPVALRGSAVSSVTRRGYLKAASRSRHHAISSSALGGFARLQRHEGRDLLAQRGVGHARPRPPRPRPGGRAAPSPPRPGRSSSRRA